MFLPGAFRFEDFRKGELFGDFQISAVVLCWREN